MKGNIYYIEGAYGYINGDDGNIYYFSKSDLLNCTIYQLSDGDRLDFSILTQKDYRHDRAIRIRKLDAVINESKQSINPGINSQFKFDHYNDDEKKIINNLQKVFYVTNSGSPFTLSNSTYRYCLVKPTDEFSLTFNLYREIPVIFSDYVLFELRSLDGAAYVATHLHSKLRLDRGCQILVSSDVNIEQKLPLVLKDTNLSSIVIPFSYKELLENNEKNFIINRFRKYLFDVDLFSSVSPIQDDLFFFGRRDYVFDIVNKCKNNTHSGIFGLRRSGKTSLLYAIKRLLDSDNFPTIYIPCQSQLAKSTWQLALYEIIKEICIETGIKQDKLHSKKSYIKENAAVCFEEDFNSIYTSIEKPIVLLFDEIEAITFNVPGNDINWFNGNYYVIFWNTIRGYYSKYPNTMSLVIAGTNPMINEIPVIGDAVVNPMYGQLSKANQGAYLLPFNMVDTQNMVNTLGGYMGLSFDDLVCSQLTIDCGGHPYLIRLLCSFINTQLKLEKIKRPKKVTIHNYTNAIAKFEETNEATGFYLMILNILVTNYPKEFNVLKEIALNGDSYVSNFVDDRALLHLLGYGLIENCDEHYKIRFTTIERYLLGKYKFERTNMSIEEQKQEIQYRINLVEIALRNLVKTTLQVVKGATEAKNIVLQSMNNHTAISAMDITKAQTLTLSELFDPSINKMYFSLLTKIIMDNISLFDKVFDAHHLSELNNNFNIINRARRVPDHSYTETSQGWAVADFHQFRQSITWLENILKDYQ